MTNKIYAYNTHYEIIDYELGEFSKLERDLSLWDDIRHTAIPKYYYDENTKILYVPRGYDPNILADHYKTFINFSTESTQRKKVKFNLYYFPKNSAQKEAVRFLSGKNEYSHLYNDAQQVLTMPPGEGKTYCTISSLSLLGYRSIIIVNTITLRDQWKERFIEYAELNDGCIKILGSVSDIEKVTLPKHKRKLNGIVSFLVTHDTLRNYMNKHGMTSLKNVFDTLQIGVKVIDEAHLEYSNTLMIDYATNVWKTIYLTATFARSDNGDNKIFQKSFNMIHKLKIESESKRRHVIYMPYIYKTKPSASVREVVRGIKGFNKYKYIDYELESGKMISVLKEILRLFIEKRCIEGKIVLLSSKKDSCDALKDLVSELYPAYSSCVYYTGNKRDDFKEFGIICATPQMLGVAIDIPGLRLVVNLEPTRSTVNTMQIIGRLREFSIDKDTYYIELVDKAFPNVWDMYKVRLKFLSPVVKEIRCIDETVIKY